MLLLFKLTRGLTGWAGSDLAAGIQPSCRGGDMVDGRALPPTGSLKVKGRMENMRALTVYFIVGFFFQWNVFGWKFSRHVCLHIA